MNVGDYVRNEDGTITRIKMFYEKKWKEPELIYARFLCENYEIYEYPRQVKSSPNIIDLIEVGDYVNGLLIKSIGDKFYNCGHTLVYFKDIKTIVTKEQFESMEYKIKGE